MQHNASHHMTDTEFFDAIRESLVILVTSSPDKRVKYRTLFNALESEKGGTGVNAYFTDSGALNIAPRKTPEKDGDYQKHALEKSVIALENIRSQKVSIRSKLAQGTLNDPDNIPLVVMTEDSGWQLTFDHLENGQEMQQLFLKKIQQLLEPKLSEHDRQWLFNHLDPRDPKSVFPGPNLKPFQEALKGGFIELMDDIYTTAHDTALNMAKNEMEKLAEERGYSQSEKEALQLDLYEKYIELRFKNHVEYSFAFDELDKNFSITFGSSGRLIDRETFNNLKNNLDYGQSIDSNFIHIPDGQIEGEERTLQELEGVKLTKSSAEVPFEYARREFAEWLQRHIGTRQATEKERDRELHIAYVSPEMFETRTINSVRDITSNTSLSDLLEEHIHHRVVAIPTCEELRQFPNKRVLNGADMVVLKPQPVAVEDGVIYDPNLMLVDYMVVNSQTDPLSMTIPVILDNRTGDFNHTLAVFKDAYQTGRLIGEFPFMVAQNETQLAMLLNEQAHILGQSKIAGDSSDDIVQQQRSGSPIPLPPRDDICTVFVAGGHANNSKQDKEEAFNLGYMLASENIRIVTGGGQVEGSMGSVHTGFIQYYLDQMRNDKRLPQSAREVLERYNYHAEQLIEQETPLLYELTQQGFIQQDMFYSYSTWPLIEMESPTGQKPAGTTHYFTGNRIRRLDALLAPETKIFMPGGVGTDEELVAALKQQMDDIQLQQSAANDELSQPAIPYGKIIIYNRSLEVEGQEIKPLNGFLKEYGLLLEKQDDHGNITFVENKPLLEKYRIQIVDSAAKVEEKAHEAKQDHILSWQERMRQPSDTHRKAVGM